MGLVIMSERELNRVEVLGRSLWADWFPQKPSTTPKVLNGVCGSGK
jgi:hypothetical protein